MDYISLHTRYWTMNQTEAFQPADSHLYGCLVHLFNSKGQGKVWPESIQYTDGSLALLVGMDVKAMDRARTRLESRGLIEVGKLGQGSRKGATYKLTTSTKKGEVKGEVVGDVMPEVEGEVEGEVSSTSPKKVEVNNQLPPQHTPQLPPQHLPKKEKYYIYIESKHQTPDKETLKKLFFVAHRDDAVVWTAWLWLLKNKKKKKPPRLAPPPPNIPFQVWYDTYAKKVDPKECETEWLKLTDDERQAALHHTGLYVEACPTKKFRKDPIRYLKRKSWNDEIIDRNEPEPTHQRNSGYNRPQRETEAEFADTIDALAEQRYGRRNY